MVIAKAAEKARHDWVRLVVTSLLSIFGTLALVHSDWLEFETSQQQVAFDRIAHLEKLIHGMYKTIVSQSATIAGLQAQLSSQPDPCRALYSFLEGMNYPAWLKPYHPDEDEFRMLYINRAYERTYNVSRQLYIGATDFEIHARDRALAYYENDLEVISKKRFAEFTEPALHHDGVGASQPPVKFWKFYVRLPDGRELVAGMQVGEL